MSLRAVPDGDEYDKDVALAIRYAVDQGAKVINASFGKKFSPNASWVQDALRYAAAKDVLFVHAAGNDGVDLDLPENPNFPNDIYSLTETTSENNYLSVGALTPYYGPDMIASFSNYGKNRVDIFAPGDEIYSTLPNSNYGVEGGTSMAAPAVAGMAALIRSLYPQLTAVQVKSIILDSGLSVPMKVRIGEQELALSDLCVSGKIANLYTALLLAEQMAAGK
jgi:subtilisin family serine protease